MNDLIKKLTGMGGMTDQIIATDFLMSTKEAIRNLAFAITESGSAELRQEMREQFRTAIDTHRDISNFMIDRGFYYPHYFTNQISLEYQTSNTAMGLHDKMH